MEPQCTKSIAHTTTNKLTINLRLNIALHPTPSPYQSRISQNTQRSFNTNLPSSYHIQEAQTSQNQNLQQPYLYQTPQQPFQPFLDASFTPMSPFNRLGRPSMSQPHPNFSGMGHELSYDGTPSMHTEEYAELSDYLTRPSPVVGPLRYSDNSA